MNHWRWLAWLFPGRAARHQAAAERRRLELARVRRAQELIAARQRENAARVDAIETELRVLSRGQLGGRRQR